MSNFVIALFFAIGGGAWVFAKVSHNHMNSKDGLIAGGVVGFFLLIILWLALNTFF